MRGLILQHFRQVVRYCHWLGHLRLSFVCMDYGHNGYCYPQVQSWGDIHDSLENTKESLHTVLDFWTHTESYKVSTTEQSFITKRNSVGCSRKWGCVFQVGSSILLCLVVCVCLFIYLKPTCANMCPCESKMWHLVSSPVFMKAKEFDLISFPIYLVHWSCVMF